MSPGNWRTIRAYDTPSIAPIPDLGPGLRSCPLVFPVTEPDLDFDAAVIDSLLRGLPLGAITLVRRVSGVATDFVLDGAKRVGAIRRHVYRSGGGLHLDFDHNRVVKQRGPGTLPTSVLAGGLDFDNAMNSSAEPLRRQIANAYEMVYRAHLVAQLCVTDDLETLAARVGHPERAEWVESHCRGDL